MLETTKLQRQERQAHQWVQQAIPSLEKLDIIYPQMKWLFETAEEKDQFMGPGIERIAKISIQEKMSILSSLTTLTIDIQKILQLSKSAYKKDRPLDFTSHEDQTQK